VSHLQEAAPIQPGKSVMLSERRAVHVGGDEGIGVEGFFDGDAANEGRNLAGDFIEAAEHDVLSGRLDSGALQEVAQAWAGKAGGAYRTFAPLNAGDLWAMQAAAVAGALEGVDYGVSFKFGKFGQT